MSRLHRQGHGRCRDVALGAKMLAITHLSLRRGGKAILTAAAIVLSAGNARAADREDLRLCQDSTDHPRMIAACTNLAQDARLPPDMRSMALLKRGFGNFGLDHLDAAEADFSEAIRLN